MRTKHLVTTLFVLIFFAGSAIGQPGTMRNRWTWRPRIVWPPPPVVVPPVRSANTTPYFWINPWTGQIKRVPTPTTNYPITDPYTQWAQANAMYRNATVAHNQFIAQVNAMANPHYYYPTAWPTPYMNPYTMPYGGSGYSNPYLYTPTPPYGSYPPAYNTPAVPPFNPPMPQGNAGPKQPSVLAAYNVPTENGAVQWPLAFRLMSPDQNRELLAPLEAQLQVAAIQAVGGKANPAVLREATTQVEALRQWLDEQRVNLAEGTYNDANAFLGVLDAALKTMAQ